MVFGKGGKNIQAAAYNGARTVFNFLKDKISVIKLTRIFWGEMGFIIWNSIVVYNQSGCDQKKVQFTSCCAWLLKPG